MADIRELRDKRGKAIADARAILDRAEGEKRDVTAEENSQYQAHITESNKFKEQIEREEQQQALEKEAAALALKTADKGKGTVPNGSPFASEEYISAMVAALTRAPHQGLSVEHIRALSTNTDTDGGFLVMPEQWVNQLIEFVKNVVFIRSKARVFSLQKAVSLGAPYLDGDVDDCDWTAELKTGNEDTGLKFGKRTLTPHPMAKRIKISNNLLANAALNPQAIALDRLGYKCGVTEEKAFMTGDGAQKPLGVFTASAQGIPTTRDISTGNSQTAPTFDGLMNAKYSLKGQYWGRADWIFHRDVLSVLAKIKDGEGQYIWRESVRAGEPDVLLGRPISMSEYAPNTLTAGLYAGILGDFSNYWIADALDMQIQILKELYAETNQTGIICRKETDGMPVLAEAFARVKLAP